MTRTTTKLLLVLAVCLSLTIFTVPTLAQEPAPTPTAQPDPEVIALRAQLEQMQRSDDRMYNTVLWSLGGLFSLALGIVFYNGFVTNRNYERELSAMRQELQAANRDIMSESLKILQNDINTRLQKFQEDLRNSEKTTAIKIEAKFTELSEKMSSTEYDIEMLAADIWIDRQIPENAIGCYVDAIDAAIASKQRYMIDIPLEKMVNAFEEGANPSTFGAKKVSEILVKLEDTYPREVERIKHLMLVNSGKGVTW
jgi:hypothetical protein